MNQLYLCKADGSLLGTMTGLQPETCILKKNAADLWELSFTVSRYIDLAGQLVQSDYYDSIDELMQIYLDGDEPVFFMIDAEPAVSNDGLQETKSVTAHSIECELNRKLLKNFKVNCGTQDSLEYLVTDENGNFNNLNEYTGLPYEYICLVNYKNPRLSLLHLALEGTDWTVSQEIAENLCKIRGQFEVSSESIYSFLMKQVSPALSIIFTFDRKNKSVSAVRFQDYGEDTGVFIGLRNIVNRIDIQSSSDDGICTRLIPTGANGLGIEYVNFGEDFLINLDYFMNTLNEYGSHKYVSQDLHDKYRAWKSYREEEIITAGDFTGTRRERYASLSRQYNQTVLDINELKNRLPNDGCSVNYKTYKPEELKAAYTAYQNALCILLALYKEENGVTQMGPPPEYTPLPADAVNIKDTVYWFDFYAYTERIIPSVEQALKMYCKTDSNGNLLTDEDGRLIELEFGNPDYYYNPDIVKEPDSYLYEWTLYGSDELEAKKKAWSETASLLFKDCFVTSGTPSHPLSYRTADAAGWNGLDAGQKALFTSMDAFIQQLNHYLDYMSFHVRNNSLTGTRCKGVIRQCEDAIAARNAEISLLLDRQRQIADERTLLARSVMPEHFSIDGKPVFQPEDLIILNSLLKEQDYSNENILITNLDNIVSTVDAQEELYQDAVKELHRLSQPQYSFTTDTDNLFALPDFAPVREHFKVGNFIRLNAGLYDDEFVKLRLVSIEHNPLLDTENITVKFSTMIKSLDGISDLAFMLDVASGSGHTGSGGSGSGFGNESGNGSGSFFGSHNAMIQISNNMLNSLLNTELFGTAVTDVILDRLKANKGNFNTLFSHSGIFDSLEAGQIRINGDCLFDCIKSNNWNGTTARPIDNTTGSILNLSDGTCNLGGKLKWNGDTLSIDGNGKFTGTVTATDGSFKGTVNATGGSFKGDIIAKSLTLADQGTFSCGKQEIDHSGKFVQISSDGLLQADNAIVRGTIYAADGKFTGEVEATSGKIGNFTLNNSRIYSGIKSSCAGIGVSGSDSAFWAGNENSSLAPFKVDHTGKVTCSNLNVNGGEIALAKTFLSEYTGKDFYKQLKINKDGLFFITTGNFSEPPENAPFNDRFELPPGEAYDIRTKDLRIIYKEGNPIIEFYGAHSTTSESYAYNRIDDNGMHGARRSTLTTLYDTGGDWNYGEYLACTRAYQQVSFSGLAKRTLYVGSDGTISAASSSRRYKQDISSQLDEYFNPHSLYDLPVCQFRYNKENGGGDDSPLCIGFIAEDVARYYPPAARWNNDHTEVDTWEMSDMFPALVKLVQEQHQEIEALKQQLQNLINKEHQ